MHECAGSVRQGGDFTMRSILSTPSEATSIDDSCCAGFFYVKNHGVPQDLIDREFEVNSRYLQSVAILNVLFVMRHPDLC